MGSSDGSDGRERAVYRGEVVITEFDPGRLDELERVVEGLTDLEEDEALYVSPTGETGLEVKKLKKDVK